MTKIPARGNETLAFLKFPSVWEASLARRDARGKARRTKLAALIARDETQRAQRAQDARDSAALSASLIAAPCRECGAQSGAGCDVAHRPSEDITHGVRPATGYIKIIRQTVAVHDSRIAAGLAAGTVAADVLAAQFPDGNLPAPLRGTPPQEDHSRDTP